MEEALVPHEGRWCVRVVTPERAAGSMVSPGRRPRRQQYKAKSSDAHRELVREDIMQKLREDRQAVIQEARRRQAGIELERYSLAEAVKERIQFELGESDARVLSSEELLQEQILLEEMMQRVTDEFMCEQYLQEEAQLEAGYADQFRRQEIDESLLCPICCDGLMAVEACCLECRDGLGRRRTCELNGLRVDSLAALVDPSGPGSTLDVLRDMFGDGISRHARQGCVKKPIFAVDQHLDGRRGLAVGCEHCGFLQGIL